ncbi:MAG: sodium:solute symporter family protein [Dehalococcoidia bacterium]|nr:sodium:solute symporter family protein [Dehalococcoidia bacterium]
MTWVVVASMALLMCVGLSARHSAGSRASFFVAGRRGSVRSIGGSLLATVVGGSATIGVAGLVYQRGLSGIWWSLVGSIGLAVLAVAVVPRIRRFDVYTLPGLIERLYGRRVATVAALLIVVAWTGVLSGQIVAASRVVGAMGTGSPWLWMTVFSIVIIVYAVVGGQSAIIRTDLAQALMIVLGLSVGAVFLVSGFSGSGGLLESLPPGSLSFPVSADFGWSDLATMCVLVGAVYVVGPDIYTRVFSARDAVTARRAALWAAAVGVPVAFLVGLMGLAARVLAPGIVAEEALPWLAANAFPSGVAAVVFAGLLAALMSSADTILLGQGVVLADDVLGRIWKVDDARAVMVARASVIGVGLLSLVLALTLRGVIASLLFAYSVFTSGIVGPVLLGLFGGSLRPSGSAALTGMCVGGALGLCGAIPGPDFPLKSELSLIGMGLSVAIPLAWTFIRVRSRHGQRMV